MEPGEGQGRLGFLDYRPLCTACGVRSARPHFIEGLYYKTCARCSRTKQTRHHSGRRRAPCLICQRPRALWPDGRRPQTCSTACENERNRRNTRRQKTAVFRALGDRCTCPGCAWHVGPCVVDHIDVLEVDHSHGNGHLIRGRTRAGNRTKTATTRWSRYLRELRSRPDSHGLLARCANCHRAVTLARLQELTR